jgi:hypothetical protein
VLLHRLTRKDGGLAATPVCVCAPFSGPVRHIDFDSTSKYIQVRCRVSCQLA